MNTAKDKIDKDTLSSPARAAEVFFVVCMLLLLAFFVYHQSTNTGFFTEKFGPLEMLCLYGPLLFGISAPAIRAWIGRRNPARPFEAATSLFLAAGSLWLATVFPFNFAHLADALPGAVRSLLAWVTDDMGRAVLILQVIIGPISALPALWKYFSIRRRESESHFKQQAS